MNESEGIPGTQGFGPRLPRRAPWLVSLAAAICGGEGAVLANLSSASYRIEPIAFGGGASQSSSAAYSSFSGIAGFVVGTGTSSDYTAHYGFFPSAGVVDVTGRFIFYNQSSWDGNSAAANANDDNAIATDKTALLPGGVSSFANYTSYSLGINGIMVDLPNGASPASSDFTFKHGNTSSPSGWALAPAPSSITVRSGAGVGGADRVTVIWPNNQIQKQWLEITVLSTANTGLSTPDTFYFGNAIGEANTGNTSPTRFTVTAADAILAINGTLNSAGITVVTDFNRNKRVNAQDALIAMNNSAVGTSALLRLNLGSGDAVPSGGSEARASLSLADESISSPPQILGRPEMTQNGLLQWFSGPVGVQPRLEQSADLSGGGRWEPVPDEWVVDYGAGIYQVVMPIDTQQRFLRLAPGEAERAK